MADSEYDQETPEPPPRRFTANIPVPGKLDVSNGNLENNWRRFNRQWKNYEVASRLEKEPSNYRCAVLLACIGEDAMEVYDGLPFSDDDDRNDIGTVLSKFEEFCIGEAHEAYEAYMFNRRCQEQYETIDAYIAGLRKLAKTCNFGDMEDRMLRDRIVVGVREDSVREKLLEDRKLTLTRCVEICRAHESSRSQAKTMSGQDSDTTVNVSQLKRYTPGQRSNRKHQNNSGKQQSKMCKRCGRRPHSYDKCPAKDAQCNKCRKRGHFAIKCPSSSTVSTVQENDQDCAFLGPVTDGCTDPWTVNLTVGDNAEPIKFKVDTGADVTVIPPKLISRLRLTLNKSSKKLFGPGEKQLSVSGLFTARLATSNQSTAQTLYVVKDLKEPLLGRPAITALGLLQRVNTVSSENQGESYRKQYPSLFSGLGKLSENYTIRLKRDAIPFAVTTPRRVALPFMPKVKEELARMEKLGVIRPISEPTEWCAPIVVVQKPSGNVRICVDLTKLNESVLRENFPLPAVDQLLGQLSGATVFSKLDCNSGFFQVPLSQESQPLTSFITPIGRYCFQRLCFGISSGPEVFHKRMSQLVGDIPGVVCDIDDVLISGKDQNEHDDRLHKVLRKLESAGVTLNEKCVFSKPEITFLGHIISAKGVAVDPGKVTAIKNFPKPTTVTEVRRLLGMVNHVGKFAQNLAETTKPLRDLLVKENMWTWSEPQETAFEQIKQDLSSAPVLAHYNAGKPTKVSCDASSYGLGAVLLQKDKSIWRPVFYASRSMTTTEQRYAQVEKEALAATWACEKFADFLVGLKTFVIETDHKPLLALLKSKQLDTLPPRIQRFRMRLMRFMYEVQYTAGKNLVTADTLSRAPVCVPNNKDLLLEDETRMFVNTVLQNLPATEKRITEIRKKLTEDSVIHKVIQYCSGEWPNSAKSDPGLKPFWSVRHALTVQQGLLLFDSRLVIPRCMREDIINRLHVGHQGIVKCRALAQTSVWWPGLSTELKSKVEKCSVCEKERKQRPEPLLPSKLPVYPWQKIGMDLFEWKSNQYLLMVDYYSRFIEIAHLNSTASSRVIEHIKSVFSRHGIPETVISDNGPQFASHEFAKFADSYGFSHVTSSPYFPEGNGESERAVQTVKNLLQKSDDPYLAMLSYRTTPLQNGFSPSELLMGRKLRTKIPVLPSTLIPQWSDVNQAKTADQRQKERQKRCFDKLHRAKSLSLLSPGQKVWMKKPTESEAVVLRQAGTRSYIIKTPTGIKRRNRSQLVLRDSTATVTTSHPREMCTLLPKDATPQQNLTTDTGDDLSEEQHAPTTTSIPVSSECQRTRSGRAVKKPVRLDL